MTELAWTSDEGEVVFTIVRDCVDVERHLAELFLTDPSMTPSLAACMAAHYAMSDVLPDALFSTEYDPAIVVAVDEAPEAAMVDCGG